MHLLRSLLLAVLGSAVPACQAVSNPSSVLTYEEASAAIRAMARDPRTPPRPILVLGGYRDVGLGPWWVARDLARVICPRAIVRASFGFATSFDACADAAVAAVELAFPSGEPDATVVVDVVAISMGGLVARHAATARPGQKRLRIARLFTISSPHRGARLASAMPAIDPLQDEMTRGSPFLARLDEALAEAPIEIHAYTRLSDAIVGAENAAPVGTNPLWVPARPLEPSHAAAVLDPLIRADIMRRLRGEPPIFVEPHAPLP